MNNLTVKEHWSSSYYQRTAHNANSADFTAAFAVDFTTSGERLTKRVAGEKFLEIFIPGNKPIEAARKLWKAVAASTKTLNIAGNGIYTMSQHGWTQEMVNQYIYETIQILEPYSDIRKIVSGGQTGADLAGGVAGVALGIPVEMTLPRGFRQRHEDGVDRNHTEEEIIEQVMIGIRNLK
jgi:hypothetical protein